MPPQARAVPSGANTARTATAQQDLEAARRLAADSDSAQANGDSGKAFELALTAWQKVRKHAGADEECRRLADKLLERLRTYGEAANEGKASPETFKTIQVR